MLVDFGFSPSSFNQRFVKVRLVQGLGLCAGLLDSGFVKF